jgi:uncharacterized protein YceK
MKVLAVLVVTLGLVASGCGTTRHANTGSTTASGSTRAGALNDLAGIAQLRSLFNTRSNEPRLIVLVSPT